MDVSPKTAELLNQCSPGWDAPRPAQSPARTTAGRDRDVDPDQAERRAIAYLNTLPGAIQGNRGESVLMEAARYVCWGYKLGEARGFQILWDHFNPPCVPEFTEREIRRKCSEAMRNPDMPFGWLLDTPLPDRPGRRPRTRSTSATSGTSVGQDGGSPPSAGRPKLDLGPSEFAGCRVEREPHPLALDESARPQQDCVIPSFGKCSGCARGALVRKKGPDGSPIVGERCVKKYRCRTWQNCEPCRAWQQKRWFFHLVNAIAKAAGSGHQIAYAVIAGCREWNAARRTLNRRHYPYVRVLTLADVAARRKGETAYLHAATLPSPVSVVVVAVRPGDDLPAGFQLVVPDEAASILHESIRQIPAKNPNMWQKRYCPITASDEWKIPKEVEPSDWETEGVCRVPIAVVRGAVEQLRIESDAEPTAGSNDQVQDAVGWSDEKAGGEAAGAFFGMLTEHGVFDGPPTAEKIVERFREYQELLIGQPFVEQLREVLMIFARRPRKDGDGVMVWMAVDEGLALAEFAARNYGGMFG